MNVKENVPWVESFDAEQQRDELLIAGRAFIESLPSEYQEVLARFDLTTLLAETATPRGLPRNRVEARILDAREALRSLFEAYLQSCQGRMVGTPDPRWCRAPRVRTVTGWGRRIRRSVHPGMNQ
jgi:hypothetical protein